MTNDAAGGHDDGGHDHDAGATTTSTHDHGHEHDNGDADDYVEEIERFRAGKDDFFRSSPSSPVPHDARHDFSASPTSGSIRTSLRGARPRGLRRQEPSAFRIPTSDGQLRPAHRAGTFTFEREGRPGV